MTAIVEAEAAKVLAAFRPGMTVYLQGGVGEPLALRSLLQANPEVLDGVSMISCLLPGMNEFDYAALNPTARMTTFMLPAAARATFQAGRTTVRPLAYSQIPAFLAAQSFDLAIFQVTAPDTAGACGFGPCADFPAMVFAAARRRLGFVNPDLPDVFRGPRVRHDALDLTVTARGPFITAREDRPSPELDAISALVAQEVGDGAAIQTGIGGAPAAAVARLKDHRRLVVRSGMVTAGYRDLAKAGALDGAAAHMTGLAIGSPEFMTWAAGAFDFVDATVTHGAEALAATPRFTAINSALEIDLFGQVNLEWRDGALFGGLGGAPDFARAALRSPGGRAILAFPATAKGGSISRIVPRLTSPTVSLARNDVDLVITEHGVADLRGQDLETRARRLITLAAPDQRDGLERAWRALGPF